MAAKDITLPADLAARSIEHFDDLVTKDIIKYAESTSELVEYRSGHEVQFRIVPSLSRKPLLASSAVSHTTPLPPDPNKKPFNPFLDPKPEEIVLNHIGSGHRLLTNKYCVTRPMLLLTAAEFQSQNEDLNEADIIAIWAVLRTVGRGWMAIYNCGPESGNSQRHKHMQCFPIFDGIKMPPEKLASNKKSISQGVDAVEGLPYKHFIAYLTSDMDGATLYQRYQELLHHTKEALKDDPEQPSYNVILVHDWMMLVPRSHAHRDGVGGNAVGMVGMIWLAREEERERWEELGVMETLEFVGVKW